MSFSDLFYKHPVSTLMNTVCESSICVRTHTWDLTCALVARTPGLWTLHLDSGRCTWTPDAAPGPCVLPLQFSVSFLSSDHHTVRPSGTVSALPQPTRRRLKHFSGFDWSTSASAVLGLMTSGGLGHRAPFSLAVDLVWTTGSGRRESAVRKVSAAPATSSNV